MSPETRIVLQALKTRELEIDEYNPISEDAFNEVLAELSKESDEIEQAFKACFEVDSTGEAYPKASGEDDFVELFEKALAGDGLEDDDDD